MSKRDRTRDELLDVALQLFNTQGYGATAINDIAERAHRTKGSIYGNFESKQALAEEAFLYGLRRIDHLMRTFMDAATHPIDKLHAMLRYFEHYVDKPPIEGGCLLLNTATEADDANPGLRNLAQRAFGNWRKTILTQLAVAHQQGLLRPDIRPQDLHDLADFLMASIEGSVLLSRLYADPERLQRVHRPLHRMLDYLKADA